RGSVSRRPGTSRLGGEVIGPPPFAAAGRDAAGAVDVAGVAACVVASAETIPSTVMHAVIVSPGCHDTSSSANREERVGRGVCIRQRLAALTSSERRRVPLPCRQCPFHGERALRTALLTPAVAHEL